MNRIWVVALSPLILSAQQVAFHLVALMWEIFSAIWYIGWGAEDMKAAYQNQLDLGTPFQPPLTDISKLANFNGSYYAYVDDLDASVARLRKEGVTVIGKPARFRKTRQRATMIEGPHRLSIQLVEGHAQKE